MVKIIVSVTFSSGDDGYALPEAFTLGDHTFQVSEVIDGWFGADHAYVKLVASDDDIYILRHDLIADEWEIVLMESAPQKSS
jgi:hypothetical protein